MKQKILILGLMTLILPLAQADVTLSPLFSDHMVLQRDKENYVWGWADAGEAITITFDGHTRSTQADSTGSWYVKLPKSSLGEAKTMTIKGNNAITINNVLMGDVWVCSGQSNMEWRVSQSKDPKKESAAANYPNIRYFQVPRGVALTEQSHLKGEWVETTPETVSNFSAVSYYFGRTLHKDLDIPIGLISTSWGGTNIETWISQSATEHSETYSDLNKAWAPDIAEHGETIYSYFTFTGKGRVKMPKTKMPSTEWWPTAPSFAYNAMIAPLWRYGITGAIWYQGESNASRAYQYRDLMQTLITDWRNQFGQGDFPFFITQLANFKERDTVPVESDWAELREAQSMAAAQMDNVGIATIIDIGEAKDIHPKDKQGVGYRLGQSALNIAYNKNVLASGPTYKSMKIKGNKIVLSFDNVGKGLKARDGILKGFAIAGKDQKFVWANAEIKGKNKVIVWKGSVSNPIAVRYAWANNPASTLYNSQGGGLKMDACVPVFYQSQPGLRLPASPFRTDDFPMITRDAK